VSSSPDRPAPNQHHPTVWSPSATLVTVHDQVSSEGPVLVHALQGVLEAGSAVAAVSDYLLTRPRRLIAEFDTDALVDYRGQRPAMTFVRDHYASVELPRIEIHEVVDDAGQPFLVLTGPEPDLHWQRFVSSVIALLEQWEVRLAVGVGAIPWPAPHTRALELSAHATDPSLIPGYQPWVGALRVPAHVSGYLEFELGQRDHAALGYAVHVPHYLSQIRYPRAALTLLDAVQRATGLHLPTVDLAREADAVDADVVNQVAASAELQALVAALETQHDEALAARGGDREGLPEGSLDAAELPTADDIAAQVEQFLAEQGRTDPPPQ
jgi:hypothetical protein